MMTSEQVKLFNLLATGNLSWVDLSLDQKELLSSTMRPNGAFTEEQDEILKEWFLLITEQQLNMINKVIFSSNLAIIPRLTIQNKLVINSDILTDFILPTDTYYSVKNILETLKIVRIPNDQFTENLEEL